MIPSDGPYSVDITEEKAMESRMGKIINISLDREIDQGLNVLFIIA
jgi:hypothetical protein